MHVVDVLVEIAALLLVNLDLYASQGVNGIGQALKPDRHKIDDVQVQVFVEHIDGLDRSAQGVGCVGLSQLAVPDIEEGIAEDGDQADLAGLVIDRADHHRVGPVVPLQKIAGPGIHAEEGDIAEAGHSFVIDDLSGDSGSQLRLQVHRIDPLQLQDISHLIEGISARGRGDDEEDQDRGQDRLEDTALSPARPLFPAGAAGASPVRTARARPAVQVARLPVAAVASPPGCRVVLVIFFRPRPAARPGGRPSPLRAALRGLFPVHGAGKFLIILFVLAPSLG